MLIALTGFMGSGKTTVGRILSDALGCPFMDLDEAVVAASGRSIPDLFATEGEAGFRKRELDALRKVLSRYASSTAVLALGGGTLTTPAAAALIREKTVCIFLDAPLETLLSRLEGQKNGRPLADADIARRYLSRQETYRQTAHVILQTEGLSPDEVADEIIISAL